MGFFDWLPGADDWWNRQGPSSGRNLTYEEAAGIAQGRNVTADDVMMGDPRGGRPTSYDDSWNQTIRQNEDFMDWQSANTQQAMDLPSASTMPYVMSTMDMLDPEGGLAQRAKANVANQAAQGQRAAESKIGAALGSRGIGGSPEASLMAQAAQGALRERLAGQTAIDQMLLGPRAALTGQLAGADTSLNLGKMQALTGQEFPMMDFLSWFENPKQMEMLEEEMGRAGEIRDDANLGAFERIGLPPFLDALFNLLGPLAGFPNMLRG